MFGAYLGYSMSRKYTIVQTCPTYCPWCWVSRDKVNADNKIFKVKSSNKEKFGEKNI